MTIPASVMRMKVADIERMLGNILRRTEKMVAEGKRDSILNEAFYRHQFSSLLTKHYVDQGVDPWKELIIIPEHPTKVHYAWKEFGLNRPKTTQKLAIDQGFPSKFDFVIRDEPRIHVEWQGPELYNAREVAKDLTKLLMLNRRSVKVFAAIVASSRVGDERHIRELTSRFYEALEFTQVILEIDDIKASNLFAFIATVPDTGAEKFIWGRV
jgi:hypothetical protein